MAHTPIISIDQQVAAKPVQLPSQVNDQQLAAIDLVKRLARTAARMDYARMMEAKNQ